MAAHALALVGRAEAAISLARDHLEGDDERHCLLGIADAQSASDDVSGAYRTSELLPEGVWSQRTCALIAIRQAQRGDLDDAVKLLDRISSERQRDSATKIIVDEMFEAGRYRDALDQYKRVKDDDVKESIRQSMRMRRSEVEPGAADYVERTIENRRRLRQRLVGFTDDDAALLRLECQARVAIHEHNEPLFRESMDEARRLITEWDTADRCSAFLSIATLCSEFGDSRAARDTYARAIDELLEAGNPEFDDPRYFVLLGLSTGNQFDSIVEVLSVSQLRALPKRLAAIDGILSLLGAFGRGLSVNGMDSLADDIYDELEEPNHRVQFSIGMLMGMADRARRHVPAAAEASEKDTRRQQGLALIDRIIADQPQLEFETTGEHRPKREFMGAYNLGKKPISGLEDDGWQEADDLPELTLEEFLSARGAVVSALWRHGSVYGAPSTDGDHDFFVWEDKFMDRTQKVEIHASQLLPEILPAAVAEVQRALAKHSTWRVMFLGNGENPKDSFFVVYPDAIRILRSNETESIVEAIEANATRRMGRQ